MAKAKRFRAQPGETVDGWMTWLQLSDGPALIYGSRKELARILRTADEPSDRIVRVRLTVLPERPKGQR